MVHQDGGGVISIKDQLAELIDLDSETYRLTDWEVEFVDAMDKRTRKGDPLTKAMESTISGIYDQVFIHGKRRART
jgi:hypothetical protein